MNNTQFRKNEEIVLEITDIGVGGEGIGRTDGCTFFVKNAVIGDRVKAVVTRMKKGYGYAKLLEVLSPSPKRIPASCPHAKRCGGCQIMELNYEEQLAFKREKVRNNLEKIGGMKDAEVLPVIGMDTKEAVPLHYRNKMQFPIGRTADGKIAAGFYAGRTHYIIDTDQCPAAPEAVSRILCAVKEFLKEHRVSVYNEQTGQGLVRHLVLRVGFRTGEVMIMLVVNGSGLNDPDYTHNVDIEASFVDKMLKIPLHFDENRTKMPEFKICSICLNTNTENTNVITGSSVRCIYGRDHIFDEIRSGTEREALTFKISPLSFYQVNPVQTEKLYAKALEFAALTGKETVWDLYCGTGTISLFLAKKAKSVKGVEIIPDAITDAIENAKRNHLENAAFFCGRAEEIFPAYYEAAGRTEDSLPDAGDFPDADPSHTVVVLDPPRKGCDRKLLDAIKKTGPARIVYVSCDSATLARDLKILSEPSADSEAMYRAEKIQPVDMFPNTVHVECVCLLSKN